MTGPPGSSQRCVHRPGLIQEIDVESARVTSETVTAETFTNAGIAVTADGRYVVWAGSDNLTSAGSWLRGVSYRDRVTGARIAAITAPSGPGADATPPLLSHPTEIKVYAWGTELSLAGVRAAPPLSSISSDGGLGLVLGQGPTPSVVSLPQGTQQCTLPGSPLDFFGARGAFSSDGSSVFVSTLTPNGRQNSLARFDARTCLLQLQVSGSGGSSLGVDPVTDRVFATWGAQTFVYDPDSLVQLAVLPASAGLIAHNETLVFDGSLPRAFVLRMPSLHGEAPFLNNVQVIDTQSLSVVGTGNLTPQYRATGIAVVPKPPPPTTVEVTVQNRRVRVDWQPGSGPGAATGYRLEAGSAAGLADIATFDQHGNALVVDGVPPGTYFVRVRAVSAGGVSAPSPDLVVEVP